MDLLAAFSLLWSIASAKFDSPTLYSVCAVAIISNLIWKRYGRGLHKVPGPFLASISSFWKWKVIWQEDMPQRNTKLHQKYGPLVRIGPNHVSAASPEALRAIHVDKKGFQKSSIYEILQPQLDGSALHNVFSTQDSEYHSILKRTIGSLYTMSALKEIQSNIDRCTSLFISRLENFTELGLATVDMSAWLQYYTFDALGEVNFSQPMGFLATGTDIDGICQLDHHMMMYFALWGQVPKFERIVGKWKSMTGSIKPNPLYNFTLDIIKSRLENPTDTNDMLNSFLRLREQAPDRLSVREVVGAVYINVVTAHDVLAITLRAVLYYLAQSPSAYSKLCNEIAEADSLGKLSRPAKYSEVSSMTYLSAVLNEALRIHPSTGTILERLVPPGGVKLHGIQIAEGTVIGVNAWVMNRDRAIFGDDVECFRPERWIGNSTEKEQSMRRNMFTWGAGSRSCIGKNLAMMQLAPVITELYRNFDLELADPQKKWHVSGAWLTRQTQMNMIISRKGRR